MTDDPWTAAVRGVVGVPETVLNDALLASLPRAVPAAPWTVEGEAVLWTTRPCPQATQALPPRLRGSQVAAVVVGGVVRYSATPVGPYAEVLGAVGGLGVRGLWASVPFMAVDSPPSLVAGRVTWGLPKTLAVVDGSPGAGALSVRGADDQRWLVTATPHAAGPAVPVPGRLMLRQVVAGLVVTSTVTATGRLRPAVVRVDVESDGPLAGWLRPGHHPGVLLSRLRLTIGEPRRRR